MDGNFESWDVVIFYSPSPALLAAQPLLSHLQIPKSSYSLLLFVPKHPSYRIASRSHFPVICAQRFIIRHDKHSTCRGQVRQHPVVPAGVTKLIIGFKKTVGRATTQVMMKAGQVEKTNDRDFETELRRYRTMEQASNKLLKETKGWLDSVRGSYTSFLCPRPSSKGSLANFDLPQPLPPRN